MLLHRFYATVVVVRSVNLLKSEARVRETFIRSGYLCPRASFDCFFSPQQQQQQQHNYLLLRLEAVDLVYYYYAGFFFGSVSLSTLITFESYKSHCNAFCPTVLAVLAHCHINLWPPMKMEMMMKLTVSAAACLELCSTYSASGQVKVISQCCLRVKAEALIVFSLPAV